MVDLRSSSALISREEDLLAFLISFSAGAVPILLAPSALCTSLDNAFLRSSEVLLVSCLLMSDNF